jgi:hypothetical protein
VPRAVKHDGNLTFWSPQAKCVLEYFSATTPKFCRSGFLAKIVETWGKEGHPREWALAMQQIDASNQPSRTKRGSSRVVLEISTVKQKLVHEIAHEVTASNSGGTIAFWSPVGKTFLALVGTTDNVSSALRDIVENSIKTHYPDLWSAACAAVAKETILKKQDALKLQFEELARLQRKG